MTCIANAPPRRVVGKRGIQIQTARNLIDSFDGFLLGTRYLLMDRDAKFCEAFRFILQEAGVEAVKLPARSRNLNAHMKRVRRSLKEECLGRMILFGERSRWNAVRQFVEHYHRERNHQGLANHLIEMSEGIGRRTGEVQCRERLGGLLRYYYREAA